MFKNLILEPTGARQQGCPVFCLKPRLPQNTEKSTDSQNKCTF